MDQPKNYSFIIMYSTPIPKCIQPYNIKNKNMYLKKHPVPFVCVSVCLCQIQTLLMLHICSTVCTGSCDSLAWFLPLEIRLTVVGVWWWQLVNFVIEFSFLFQFWENCSWYFEELHWIFRYFSDNIFLTIFILPTHEHRLSVQFLYFMLFHQYLNFYFTHFCFLA